MTDHDALIFANEAFYAAFREGDFATMEQIWADDEAVFCVHPGWNPLYGRDAVLGSWQRILRNSARPNIICHEQKPQIIGDVGLVICFEQIDADFLVASNMFVRSPQSNLWRLIHHHSGPAATPPEISSSDPPAAVN